MTILMPLLGNLVLGVAGTAVMLLWPGASTDDPVTLFLGLLAGTLVLVPVAWRMSREITSAGVVRIGNDQVLTRRVLAGYIVLMPLLYSGLMYGWLFLASSLPLPTGGFVVFLPPLLAFLALTVVCGWWLSPQSA